MLDQRTISLAAAAIVLWLAGSGCNSLRNFEPCDPADEKACLSGQICDPQLELCVLPEGAATCDLTSENLDCSVGQRCATQTHTCVDDAYALVVVARRDDPLIVRRALTLIEFTVRRAASLMSELELLSRPIVVERLEIDQSDDVAMSAGFATLNRPNVLGTIYFASDLAIEAQRRLSPYQILSIALATNLAEFEDAETSANRWAYGIVPAPRADLAMWSKFLSQWQPDPAEPWDAELGACSKLGFVYRDIPPNEFMNSIIRAQLARYGGLTLDVVADIEGDVSTASGEIYEKLAAGSVDCVMLGFLLVDETTALIGGHRQWRETTGSTHRIRWMPGSFPAGTYREILAERGLEDELTGTIGSDYIVGGQRSDELLAAFLPEYEAEATAACATFEDDDCLWFSPAAVAADFSVYPGFADDQAMLLLVAAIFAERRFGVNFTREELRDGFLSVTANTGSRSPCTRKDLSDCADKIDAGLQVHYRGVSGDLVFGADGRAESIEEIMTFHRMRPDGELEELARFTHEEMLAAYKNPNPKAP